MIIYKKGKGLLNYMINKVPIELHIPGYQYCGPGTKLQKRLARGDPGINPLDVACKEHDIAYEANKNGPERTKADRALSAAAWKRVVSRDASVGERTAALAVSAAMKSKLGMAKFGRGLKKLKKKATKKKAKKQQQRKKKCCSFKTLVSKTKKQIKASNPKTADDIVKTAMAAAKEITNKNNGVISGQTRIIPIPKSGGILPLIPIFAGLSALGSLAGGAAAVYNAVRATRASKKGAGLRKEGISIGKSTRGQGVYLRPYRKGYGIYLQPYASSKIKKSKN